MRRQDPLLFNRLGATLANGGKAELAIQYYLEAIEIQPSYVRARFNLAVANMNLNVSRFKFCRQSSDSSLQQHQSAAEHLITALSIQESDSEQHSESCRCFVSAVADFRCRRRRSRSDEWCDESGVVGLVEYRSAHVRSSLRLCMSLTKFCRMHRNDLAAMCGNRDLAGIKLQMPVEDL